MHTTILVRLVIFLSPLFIGRYCRCACSMSARFRLDFDVLFSRRVNCGCNRYAERLQLINHAQPIIIARFDGTVIPRAMLD